MEIKTNEKSLFIGINSPKEIKKILIYRYLSKKERVIRHLPHPGKQHNNIISYLLFYTHNFVCTSEEWICVQI